MALNIQLRPEVNMRLRAEAARRGKAEEEVAAELIDRALPAVAGENDSEKEDSVTYILRLTEKLRAPIPEEER